jgi:L-rhamnose isomerase
MQLMNIGYGSMISFDRIVAIVSPEAAPVKRIVQAARDSGKLIDASCGRKTKSVIVTDSDHVVLFDDETREIAREIVRCGGLEGRVNIALDYFDASINRISAWVSGYRNLQKALLYALLQPNGELKDLQDTGRFSKLMVLQEELKTMPFGEIWNEYCLECGKPGDGEWFPMVEEYERKVLVNRK